ncbi:4836_t:CDS:1, partial [Funneliformis mosseae]
KGILYHIPPPLVPVFSFPPAKFQFNFTYIGLVEFQIVTEIKLCSKIVFDEAEDS